jgi:hypothetical protein
LPVVILRNSEKSTVPCRCRCHTSV